MNSLTTWLFSDLVKDINPGTSSGVSTALDLNWFPSHDGSKAFFRAQAAIGASSNIAYRLFVTDGTANGTIQLSPPGLIFDKGVVLPSGAFAATLLRPGMGFELWYACIIHLQGCSKIQWCLSRISDGSVENTRFVSRYGSFGSLSAQLKNFFVTPYSYSFLMSVALSPTNLAMVSTRFPCSGHSVCGTRHEMACDLRCGEDNFCQWSLVCTASQICNTTFGECFARPPAAHVSPSFIPFPPIDILPPPPPPLGVHPVGSQPPVAPPLSSPIVAPSPPIGIQPVATPQVISAPQGSSPSAVPPPVQQHSPIAAPMEGDQPQI